MRVLCSLCGVLLAACLGGQTGQEDEPPVECEIERTPLQANDPTSLGFTAAQLEAEVTPARTSGLYWYRMSTSTQLTLTLREVRARALSVSTNRACPDTIDLEAVVAVSTEDGLLDEELAATISAQALATWSLTGEVAFDAIAGELDASDLDLDLSNWRAPRLSLQLGGSELHGLISLDGEDPNSSDSEVPTSASLAELLGP